MKKKMVTALLAVSMLAGLSAVNVMAADDDTITVGFSQVGAESVSYTHLTLPTTERV